MSYFGAAHPALYNINAIDVRSGGIDTHSAWPDDDAVVAVSATHLQGFAIDTESRPFYAELRKREPLTILGGSIYLFELAPSSFDAAQRGAHNE